MARQYGFDTWAVNKIKIKSDRDFKIVEVIMHDIKLWMTVLMPQTDKEVESFVTRSAEIRV